MIGIFLCILAFGLTNAMTRRSLGAGLVALMTVGYAYGLIRARVPDGGTHFIFDAALMGLYARAFSGLISAEMRLRTETATWWTLGLMAWPIICMFYAPLVTDDAQPLIIQLVGLRGAVLMLPCLVLGARLKRADFDILAPALAVLNLVALAFALLEYFFGIETFIPHNAVSDIIYESTVITNSGEAFLRIPSTFLSSHAYGGMMTLSVAYIAHGLEMAGRARLLCLAGLGAAILGVFMCGSRLPVVELTLATIYVLGSFRMRSSTVFAFALTALAVSYVVVNFERFQRFETLSDPDAVRSRISMSVNMSFFEILNAYPLGAGLASGFGTSVPYFLFKHSRHPQSGRPRERVLSHRNGTGGRWPRPLADLHRVLDVPREEGPRMFSDGDCVHAGHPDHLLVLWSPRRRLAVVDPWHRSPSRSDGLGARCTRRGPSEASDLLAAITHLSGTHRDCRPTGDSVEGRRWEKCRDFTRWCAPCRQADDCGVRVQRAQPHRRSARRARRAALQARLVPRCRR